MQKIEETSGNVVRDREPMASLAAHLETGSLLSLLPGMIDDDYAGDAGEDDAAGDAGDQSQSCAKSVSLGIMAAIQDIYSLSRLSIWSVY
eukprot:scaffold21589_cov56-Attheya_sp.AAC.5